MLMLSCIRLCSREESRRQSATQGDRREAQRCRLRPRGFRRGDGAWNKVGEKKEVCDTRFVVWRVEWLLKSTYIRKQAGPDWP